MRGTVTSRLALLAALALLAGVIVAACGSGGATGGASPATAVPADVALYVEATVRPQGDLRDAALAAAGKLLRTQDPQERIRALVTQAFAKSRKPRLDYARDVEPWLGDKVGLWLRAGAGQKSRGVVLIAAKDKDTARRKIEAAIARSGEKWTRRGHVEVGPHGTGFAMAGDFAAFGTETELERTLAAQKGESLAESARYRQALDGLPVQRLGGIYFDVRALLDAATRANPSAGAGVERLRQAFPVDRMGPIAGAFTADGQRLAFDTQTSKGAGELLQRFGLLLGMGSTPLVGELPADAWLALGAPRVGASLRSLYQSVSGALGGAAIAAEVRRQTGLDLEQDVFAWIGDAVLFVRGTSPHGVDGALVIQATDAARAASAFGKLVGVLRTRGRARVDPIRVPAAESAFAVEQAGKDEPVVLARGRGRVVAAYGERAAADALQPRRKLAGAGAYRRAGTLLGHGLSPSFLVSIPEVLQLVDASGRADPGYAKAKPYLQALGVVAGGGRVAGGRARSRVVVALR